MPSRYMLKGTSVGGRFLIPPDNRHLVRRSDLPLVLAANPGEELSRSIPEPGRPYNLDDLGDLGRRSFQDLKEEAQFRDWLRQQTATRSRPGPWGRASSVFQDIWDDPRGTTARFARSRTVRVVGRWVFTRIGGPWSYLWHVAPLGVGTPRRGDPDWFPSPYDEGVRSQVQIDPGIVQMGQPFDPDGRYREPLWTLPPMPPEQGDDYQVGLTPDGQAIVGEALPPPSVRIDFDLGKWRAAARRSYNRQLARSQALKVARAEQLAALQRDLDALGSAPAGYVPGASVQPPRESDYYTFETQEVWNGSSYERVSVRVPDRFRYEQALREWRSNQEFEAQRRAEAEAEALAWQREVAALRQREQQARELLQEAVRQEDQLLDPDEASRTEVKLRFGRRVALQLLVQPGTQVSELRNEPKTWAEKSDDQKANGRAYRRLLGLVNNTLGPLAEAADLADALNNNLVVYNEHGTPLTHLTFLQKVQRYAEGNRAEILWDGLVLDLVVMMGEDAAIGFLSQYDRQLGEAMGRPVGAGAGWAL